MYDYKNKYSKTFDLTENEIFFGHFTIERVIEIINDPEVKVIRTVIADNLYGEFLFIDVIKLYPAEIAKDIGPNFGKTCFLQFFGLGYHEHRGQWLDYFKVNTDCGVKRNNTPMDKVEVIEQIKEQAKNSFEAESDEYNELYSILAAMTDDDAAWNWMEDNENPHLY